MSSSPSHLEIVKKQTRKALREYCREMGREFERISDELDALYDEDVDEPKTKRRIERLEAAEARHAKHVEELADMIAGLSPDESSYA